MNERVIIIAPVGNDAERMSGLLKTYGFHSSICMNFSECCQQIELGAGVLLFTEEALELPNVYQLLELLKSQPSWSELPLIILSSGGEGRLVKLLDITAQAAGSLTLLERPLSSPTLVRSVEVGLRSRRRQYHVRDLMDEQKKAQKILKETNHELNVLAAELEKRIKERTSQLEEQAENLRHLAVEMTEIEEGERKRLAQILHDHLQQFLVAAKIRLELFERKTTNVDMTSLKEVQSFIQQAYDASRSLTAELRPPVLYESGLLAAIHFLIRKFHDQHKLTVHFSFTEDVEPRSDVFKTFIYQSIQELLFNIVKYAKITECFLKLERIDKEIRIVLHDQGQGFDPNDIGKKGSGGFGLFSIRERMKGLGGELKVTSSPGKGSTFEMIIPDFIIDDGKQEVAQPLQNQVPSKNPSGSLRVLIADDHKIVRQSLSKVLQMQPFIHEVIEAEDGRDAVLKAEEYRPDVVLMDMNMPHLNGLEATRILHARIPQLKIIGLSVQSEAETAQAMKKAGAIEYFNKNTDTDILVETLRELVKEALV